MISIKDIKEIGNTLQSIIRAPFINILLFSGIAFIIISFFIITIGDTNNIMFTDKPKLGILLIGIVLLTISIVLYLLFNNNKGFIRKVNLESGIDISFRHTTIHIKKGKIEATNSRSAFSATILPSNTSFIDDCITDLNSALGSYILNWFPGKIDDFKTAVVSSLKKLDINTVDGVNYPPGTTIIVDSPFDNPSKIIITASTLRKPNAGIRSEPGMICECIKQIFIKTSDKKISELYLPILGSGHGGLDIEIALICLVLSIKYFSARFHHIKDITILITENDCGKLSEKDKIVFWSLLRRGL